MNLSITLSKLSIIDPRGHIQPQKTFPNTKIGIKKSIIATKVGIKIYGSTLPVNSVCMSHTGQISHDPGAVKL